MIRAGWTLFAHTLGRILRPPRGLVNLGLFAFPVLMAGAIAMLARPSEGAAGGVAIYMSLYVVAIATALVNGLGATASEFEDGSFTLVYSGILRRWQMLLVKAGAVFAACFFGMGASLAGVLALASPEFSLQTLACFWAIGGLGLAVYVGLFVFCGCAFRHPMSAGLVICTIFELMITRVPTLLAPLTVANGVRTLIYKEIYGGEPPARVLGYFREFERQGISLMDETTVPWYLMGLAIALTAAAAIAISRRPLTGRETS